MTKLINTVLFDLDGTLLDSARDLHACLNQLLTRYDKPAVDLSIIQHHLNVGAVGFIEFGFGKDISEQTRHQLREEFLEIYQQHLLKEPAYFFPGTLELIKNLHKNHYRCGVVTNKHERFALPILNNLGLLNELSVVLCGNQVQQPKPSPQPLWQACEMLHTDSSYACYIGDSQVDLEAATQADMPALLACWGYWQTLHYDVSHWPATEIFYTPEKCFEWLGKRRHSS